MTDQPDRPAAEASAGLLGDIVTGFARLLRGELALARAEAKRSLGEATAAMAKLVLAVIFGITAVNVLAGAAVAGLVALGLAPIWASVLVGCGLLLLAYALVQIALPQLKPSNLVPTRTMANLRQDAETLTSMGNPDATSRQ